MPVKAIARESMRLPKREANDALEEAIDANPRAELVLILLL